MLGSSQLHHLYAEDVTRRTVRAFLSTAEPISECPSQIPGILQHITECNAAGTVVL